jgi:hypothetical protein
MDEKINSLSVMCVYMISFCDSPDATSNNVSVIVTEYDTVFGLHGLKLEHQRDRRMVHSTTVDKMYLTNSRSKGCYYILLSTQQEF